MRLLAHHVAWTPRTWAADTVLVKGRHAVAGVASRVDVATDTPVWRRPAGGDLSRSLGVVRTLAFCQALFFLALFLLICAWAHATAESKRSFNAELTRSTYAPEAGRDPFGSGGGNSAAALSSERIQAAMPSMLKLKGILYDAVHPAAIVNEQIVELNKPATVQTEQGETEIKALRITREAVLLEVGGQKVELRLGGGERDTTSP